MLSGSSAENMAAISLTAIFTRFGSNQKWGIQGAVVVPFMAMFIVPFFFVIVMAFSGRTARGADPDELQARRRATDVPFLLYLHMFEVNAEDMAAIQGRRRRAHSPTTIMAGRPASPGFYQLHRIDQVAVVSVERV